MGLLRLYRYFQLHARLSLLLLVAPLSASLAAERLHLFPARRRNVTRHSLSRRTRLLVRTLRCRPRPPRPLPHRIRPRLLIPGIHGLFVSSINTRGSNIHRYIALAEVPNVPTGMHAHPPHFPERRCRHRLRPISDFRPWFFRCRRRRRMGRRAAARLHTRNRDPHIHACLYPKTSRPQREGPLPTGSRLPARRQSQHHRRASPAPRSHGNVLPPEHFWRDEVGFLVR